MKDQHRQYTQSNEQSQAHHCDQDFQSGHSYTALIEVESTVEPERIDRFLCRQLMASQPSLSKDRYSRNRIRQFLDQGRVSVDSITIYAADFKVKPGQVLAVKLPPPSQVSLPQADATIDLDIVHEDKDIIVVNKPSGLVTHLAPGHTRSTLVNALLAHCPLASAAGLERPGIVHRLDRDTSGLLVVAKSNEAYAHLKDQFQRRTIIRRYSAFVWGVPPSPMGEISVAIGRSTINRLKMAGFDNQTTARTRRACTIYAIVTVFAGGAASLLDCHLHSGRTHQIRVHFEHIGHPVIGDQTYGRRRHRQAIDRLAPRPFSHAVPIKRQALHAQSLSFVHPVSGKTCCFEAPWPEDMTDVNKFFQQLPPLGSKL